MLVDPKTYMAMLWPRKKSPKETKKTTPNKRSNTHKSVHLDGSSTTS